MDNWTKLNLDRETLEKEALKAVCSCWYYDLADTIEETPTEELQKVVDCGIYFHLQNQYYNPTTPEEFTNEVMNCGAVNFGVSQRTTEWNIKDKGGAQ